MATATPAAMDTTTAVAPATAVVDTAEVDTAVAEAATAVAAAAIGMAMAIGNEEEPLSLF